MNPPPEKESSLERTFWKRQTTGVAGKTSGIPVPAALAVKVRQAQSV
jgi:hypothetical protein